MRAVWISFGLALAAALILLFAPLGTSVSPVSAGSGRPSETIAHPSLVEQEGWWVAILLAVPVAIAAIPLGARGRWRKPVRVTAAVLLGVFAGVGIYSVGLFFLPSTVAMIIAASSERRSQGESP